MNETEAAIDRLESIEAIKKLKHTYMAYCDQGYPPAKLGPLFTDDAVWTSEIFGHHAGRPAIDSEGVRCPGFSVIEENGEVVFRKFTLVQAKLTKLRTP